MQVFFSKIFREEIAMKLVSWQTKLTNIYAILYCLLLKEAVRPAKGNPVPFPLPGCLPQGPSLTQSGVLDVLEIVGSWRTILSNSDTSSERHLSKSICEILVIKIHWLIITTQADWSTYRTSFGAITFPVLLVLFGLRAGHKMCIFGYFRIQCQ